MLRRKLLPRMTAYDSINFIRQNLTLTEEGSAGATFRKVMTEYASQGKDYYRPLDMDKA